ncbi:hypothetical protein AGMMS50229_04570 [Campylobacterota bacterium]|nr:hypothetical protein AGMMS50229_04570 [Campylobacterota bacterium]
MPFGNPENAVNYSSEKFAFSPFTDSSRFLLFQYYSLIAEITPSFELIYGIIAGSDLLRSTKNKG